MEEHMWASITHDLSYTLTHFGSIAVHAAVGAGGLVGTKGAAFDALGGIISQFLAFCTEWTISISVLPATVESDHLEDGIVLAFKTLVLWFNHYPP